MTDNRVNDRPNEKNIRRTKSGLKFNAFALILVVLIVGGYLYFQRDDGNILRKATMVAKLPTTTPPPASALWTSKDTIRIPTFGAINGEPHAMVNVKTGKEFKMDALEATYRNEVRESKLPETIGILASPDGTKFVTFLGGHIFGDTQELAVIDKSGKLLSLDKIAGQTAVIDGKWLPDSSGIVKWFRYMGTQPKYHFKLCYFDGRKPIEADYTVTIGMRLSDIRFDNDGTAFAIDAPNSLSDTRKLCVVRFPLTNSKKIITTSLPYIPNTIIAEFSPDGKKILIRCTEFMKFPLTGFRKFLNRWFRVKESYSSTLWICDSDGENLHRIAWTTLPTALSTSLLKNVIMGCQWMPDSKHLSYVDKQVLYSIPTD